MCASNLQAAETFAQKAVYQASRAFPDAIFYKQTTEKVVALTIDDVPAAGDPEDSSTRLVLDVIAQHNSQIADPDGHVRATFFVISDHLKDGSTIVAEIEEQGHEIANHGVVDDTAALLSADAFELSLRTSNDRIAEFASKPVRWYRPGRGLFKRDMASALRSMEGYEPRFALASMLPVDSFWPTDDPKFTAWYVGQHVFPGSILVLHVSSPEIAMRTSEALKLILDDLKGRGYRVVTLSELWDKY